MPREFYLMMKIRSKILNLMIFMIINYYLKIKVIKKKVANKKNALKSFIIISQTYLN